MILSSCDFKNVQKLSRSKRSILETRPSVKYFNNFIKDIPILLMENYFYCKFFRILKDSSIF